MIGHRFRGFALLLFIGTTVLGVERPLAAAEPVLNARDAVERHVAAIGGRDVLASVRTTRLWNTLSAFGLTGRAEGWLEAPDRRATEVTLGPFTLRDGCDGTRAWRTDASGHVIVLDGIDLEEANAEAWFENDRWLAPDGGGGTIAMAPGSDPSGSHVVLDVTPPRGRPRRVYLDRATWLIDRWESKRDQATVTIRLTDYREVQGRMIAFRSVQSISGMPGNDAILTLDSARVNVAIEPERFSPPGERGAAMRYMKTLGVARLPFEYSARHVWLRAAVNDAPPADFLYDTGASITVLDSAYAASLGLATEGRVQGEGAAATGTASFARIGRMRIAAPDSDGVEIADLRVAVLDLNGLLAPFFWRPAAGVIGFDFIVRFVNEIDFDARTLVLSDPSGFEYRGQGAAIPMTLAGHAPIVKLTLDGEYEGQFRLDVGSGSTVDLHAPFVRRYGLDHAFPAGVEVVSGGFGGTFRNRITRATSLAIGPYSVPRPLVGLSGARSGALASEDYAGNIGNQLLERFKCTLDYQRRMLYLEPGARFGKPDAFSRSGLLLAKTDGIVRAAQVVEGSPAARAGIRTGDQVIEIAGRPVLEYTVDAVAALLEQGEPGRKVKLAITRDGKRKKVTVKLADML